MSTGGDRPGYWKTKRGELEIADMYTAHLVRARIWLRKAQSCRPRHKLAKLVEIEAELTRRGVEG